MQLRRLCNDWATAIPALALRKRDSMLAFAIAALGLEAVFAAGQRTTIGSELVLLIILLLGMRWQLRGALVGTGLSLVIGAGLHRVGYWGQTSTGQLLLQGGIWLIPALTVALLARRLVFHSEMRQRLAEHEQERDAAEEAIRASEERFRSLLQNASDLMAVLDADGTLRYVSPSVERLLGYGVAALTGTRLFELVHPDDRVRVLAFHAEQLATPPVSVPIEFQCRDQDGGWHHLEASFTNLLRDPSVGGVVVNARDVTERVRFQERLSHQAFHDPLTGLPNRALFMDRLDHALARNSRHFHPTGVLFLDLDRFKVINDSLGHAAGDALLAEVGRRFGGCLRSGDSVARLGGDEFAVLLEDVCNERDATEVADRILACMRDPVAANGGEIFVGVSIGIALSTPQHARPTDLLQEADLALYWAKGLGRGCYAVFDPIMSANVAERLDLETELRRALERGELRLYFQPIVSLASQRLTEVEALVRWEHPVRGLIEPAQFIPLAEETGLIVPLGHWVLREACLQAARWTAEFPALKLVIGVNLSARQFCHPTLVEDVAAILAETGADPRLLKLELTESAVMDDAVRAIQTLERLREMGVLLAIDDFGMGYSSLSYLKRLPVTTLKIDRSFIDGLATDSHDSAIVRSIVALAKSLGLQVTGEGIETTEQLTCLQALGCEQGQGYLFARPLSADSLAEFLPAMRPRAA
ncbi:MAG: putative bifunctional diguanylate cyclase/phosphodiesterase [Dehalococcoidia bacterium]